MLKRAFDFFVSCFIILFTSPIILFLAGLIRIKLGSPVIFYQYRPGLHGRPFKMIKFRTMTEAVDHDTNLLPDEHRLTPFGQFLRSTSLDELPELWNVLMGKMSLVGPRPLLLEYLPLYNEAQQRRHLVKPGMTGWAQINGRNALSWDDKFKHDVWYVDNSSFWLDIKILFFTVKKVFLREGIHSEGQVTMEKFQGSVVRE